VDKPIIYFLLILLAPFSIYAQEHKIDSVLTLITKDKKEDTNKAQYYDILSGYYSHSGQMDKSMGVADSSLAISQKLNYQKGICNAYSTLGNDYLNTGDLKKSLDCQQKALKIAEDLADKHLYAAIVSNIGNVYEQQGDYLMALDCFEKSLKMEESTGDKRGAALNTNNIAIIYAEQGNFPKALDYFFKSVQLNRLLKDTTGIARATGNIGIIYNDEGDYAKALDYYLQALKLNEAVGDKNGIVTNTSNIGSTYNHLDDHQKALEYLNKALKMAEETGNKHLQVNNLTNLGTTYRALNDTTKSMEYFLKALKIAKEMGNKGSVEKIFGTIGESYNDEKKYATAEKYLLQGLDIAHEIGDLYVVRSLSGDLSDTYEKMQQWQKAYQYYSQFILFKDSLVNGEKSKEIGRLEAREEFDKQSALQKAAEDESSELSKAESKRQKIIILFVGVIALAIALVAFTVFRSLKTTRKQKKLIELQKVAVEQQKILVEEKNKEVLDSINYAKRLQDAILPSLAEIKKILPESFVLYKPKDIVAGDFYWMEKLNGTTLIAAADCTGHGVPGAMVSVVCSNALNRAVKEFGITEPGKILDKVRELVLETFAQRSPLGEISQGEVQDGMDISLAAISHESTGNSYKVQWSGANTPLWYLIGNALVEVAPDKQPVGRQIGQKPFFTNEISLPKGSTFYLFTDGFADQFGGPKGKKFKYKQFQDTFTSLSKASMNEQKEKLNGVFENWKGKLEQVDDVLVIGVRV
jgi:tetratricopeptide (TPR) repeat protein